MTGNEQVDRSGQGAEDAVDIPVMRIPKQVADEWRRALHEYRPRLDRQIRDLVRSSITDADVDAAASAMFADGEGDLPGLSTTRQGQETDNAIAQWLVLLIAASAYRQTPDHVRELIAQDPAARDVVATSGREEAVQEFRRLLEEEGYFNAQKRQVDGRPEAVWQQFLQKNQWILGGSLSVQFLPAWNAERLEQTVVGSSVKGEGKRNDALLRTAGRVNSLVFVEIKHHQTKLLGAQYRPGIWLPSKELSGGVVQVQGTVQRATMDIRERLQKKASDGSDILGEFSYLLRPRSYLIVGSLEELYGEGGGLNTDKYQSFELHRRHMEEPEIVTFDELLARAEGLLDVSTV
jgi:hypothetical protein